jgi:poly(A) polymerase
VVREQAARIAMPRRFTLPMTEIWALQSRLESATRKRAARMLAHPRFRAAYDFLLLRALDDPRLRELAAFWTEAQQGGSPAPPAAPGADEAEPGAEAAPKKRRRRRRGAPKAGAPAADGD